jgi:hypothetical protein
VFFAYDRVGKPLDANANDAARPVQRKLAHVGIGLEIKPARKCRRLERAINPHTKTEGILAIAMYLRCPRAAGRVKSRNGPARLLSG